MCTSMLSSLVYTGFHSSPANRHHHCTWCSFPPDLKPFRINTCRSLTKQMTLTIPQSTLTEKPGGWGVTVNQAEAAQTLLFTPSCEGPVPPRPSPTGQRYRHKTLRHQTASLRRRHRSLSLRLGVFLALLTSVLPSPLTSFREKEFQ